MEDTTTNRRITFPEAKKLQEELREKLLSIPAPEKMTTIGGADLSFNRFGTTFYAGIVILSFPDMKLIGRSLVKMEVHFPYVPGYLSFREVPPLLLAWNQIPVKPDVVVLDGHGVAHPRRMGVAAHFGCVVHHPTIGCAKKKLYGEYKEPLPYRDAVSPLTDPGTKEILGYVLRTREKVKPVFISPGNMMNMDSSIQIIKQCMRRHRLPEPTRMAHEAVNMFRRGELNEGYEDIQ